MNLRCPKCGGIAPFREVNGEVALDCLCGYYKVMATPLVDSLSVSCYEIDDSPVLPKKGSKLSQCINALHSLGEATSKEVLSQVTSEGGGGIATSMEEVTTMLLYLKHRGLVLSTKDMASKASRLHWRLSGLSLKLLGNKQWRG
jgi:hypothetical protein